MWEPTARRSVASPGALHRRRLPPAAAAAGPMSAAAPVDAGAAAAAALEAARAALPKPVVLTGDMPAELVTRCTDLAAEALVTYKVEKDQAMHVKKALEAWNGALWHVVVGASFGASVCHEVGTFTMFKIGKAYILCFQSFDDASILGTEKKVVKVAKKAEVEEAPAAE